MEHNSISVPVIIDSIKETELFPMTRCSYFCIENRFPMPDWSLAINEAHLPFMMVGLEGIVIKPADGRDRFDSIDTLDHFFNIFDTHESLYVDQNHIFLPNKLFQQKALRGDVYRIDINLFHLAFAFREDGMPTGEFVERAYALQLPEFSGLETIIMRTWNERQIEIIRKEYHDDDESQLRKKNNNNNPRPRTTP